MEFSYPVELSIINVSVIKATADRQGLKKFASHFLSLRKLLESVFTKRRV